MWLIRAAAPCSWTANALFPPIPMKLVQSDDRIRKMYHGYARETGNAVTNRRWQAVKPAAHHRIGSHYRPDAVRIARARITERRSGQRCADQCRYPVQARLGLARAVCEILQQARGVASRLSLQSLHQSFEPVAVREPQFRRGSLGMDEVQG